MSGQSGAEAPKFLSVLRLLRLMRLARLIRLVKIFKELWLVVQGLIESFKVLFWVIMLLVMVIYPFAIFLNIWLESDCDAMMSDPAHPFPLCKEMFGTVP